MEAKEWLRISRFIGGIVVFFGVMFFAMGVLHLFLPPSTYAKDYIGVVVFFTCLGTYTIVSGILFRLKRAWGWILSAVFLFYLTLFPIGSLIYYPEIIGLGPGFFCLSIFVTIFTFFLLNPVRVLYNIKRAAILKTLLFTVLLPIFGVALIMLTVLLS